MGWETDIELVLAFAEERYLRQYQKFKEERRQERRQRELERREQLKREIAAIQWRAA